MTTTLSAPAKPAAARPRTRTRRNGKWGIGSALRFVTLYGFAIFCVVPLVWLLLAPTKLHGELETLPWYAFGSFENLAAAWGHLTAYQDGIIFVWIGNSLLYTTVSIAISVAISVTAGYALAMTRFPGRKLVLWLTIVALVLPGAALVLPLFLEMDALGLTDSALSFILISAFYPFGTYLSFIYFGTSLSPEVLEATRIDGCSETRAFISVALPLAKPLIGLIVFFSAVANWSNYFMPYILLFSDEKFPLPVGLGALMASTQAGAGSTLTGITRPEIALAGLIMVLPVALLFIFFQRFLATGILEGSSKG